MDCLEYDFSHDPSKCYFKHFNIFDIIDPSLQKSFKEELKKINDFEDLAGIDLGNFESQKDLLKKLLEAEKTIENEEFSSVHIRSSLYDGEYYETVSYLTMYTPVLATIVSAFEVLYLHRDAFVEIQYVEHRLRIYKKSLEDAKLKYKDCKDEEFKESLLSDDKIAIEKIEEHLSVLQDKFNCIDLDLIINGENPSNKESFYVKNSLASILKKVDFKKVIDVIKS